MVEPSDHDRASAVANAYPLWHWFDVRGTLQSDARSATLRSETRVRAETIPRFSGPHLIHDFGSGRSLR